MGGEGRGGEGVSMYVLVNSAREHDITLVCTSTTAEHDITLVCTSTTALTSRNFETKTQPFYCLQWSPLAKGLAQAFNSQYYMHTVQTCAN